MPRYNAVLVRKSRADPDRLGDGRISARKALPHINLRDAVDAGPATPLALFHGMVPYWGRLCLQAGQAVVIPD
jgi:hypothetical protein